MLTPECVFCFDHEITHGPMGGPRLGISGINHAIFEGARCPAYGSGLPVVCEDLQMSDLKEYPTLATLKEIPEKS